MKNPFIYLILFSLLFTSIGCSTKEITNTEQGNEPRTTAEVKIVDGIAELYVNGKPASRMWARPDLPGHLGPDKLEQYRDAGIQIYFIALDFSNNLGWNGDDTYDFAIYDDLVKRMVEAKPDIKLILYCGIRGETPYRWCRDNPDELTVLHTGLPLANASIASKVWRKDVTNAFAKFVEHYENSPYANNIIGYNPVMVNGNEWWGLHGIHDTGRAEPGYGDYSKPMVSHFREWLRKRYGNDLEKFREAWQDTDVTFETAELPMPEERFSVGKTDFFTPLYQGMRAADYHRCYDELMADLAIDVCRTIKETLEVPKITGLMYGYSHCGIWTGFPQRQGHGSADRVMKSEYVDFFQSPYDYHNRSFGATHYSQHAIHSILNHGKLMIDQIDSKPHTRYAPNRNADTPWESEQLLKRDVAYSLTNNCHFYWLEGGPGNMLPVITWGSRPWSPLWYDDPDLKALMKELGKVADENRDLKPAPAAEYAIITSNESMYYRRAEDVFARMFVVGQRHWVLNEVGAPFDDYRLEDFENITRKYKAYLFLNAHYISSELREKIKQKIDAEGATAIWFYAPGYIDEEGFDLANIEALTGIKLKAIQKHDYLQVDNLKASHPFMKNVSAKSFGTDMDPQFFKKDLRWLGWPDDMEKYKFSPLFAVDDPDAEALGKLRGTDETGFAVKQVGNRKSVYIGAPMVPVQLMRNILASAGVHLYSQGGEMVYANQKFVMISLKGDGSKTIALPRMADVYDAYTGNLMSENSNQITLDGKHGEIFLLRLEDVKN